MLDLELLSMAANASCPLFFLTSVVRSLLSPNLTRMGPDRAAIVKKRCPIHYIYDYVFPVFVSGQSKLFFLFSILPCQPLLC